MTDWKMMGRFTMAYKEVEMRILDKIYMHITTTHSTFWFFLT